MQRIDYLTRLHKLFIGGEKKKLHKHDMKVDLADSLEELLIHIKKKGHAKCIIYARVFIVASNYYNCVLKCN